MLRELFMSLYSEGNVRYVGQASPLFKLAFVTGFLTLITAGIYRFWSKTRIRKYIWSSLKIDGDAFEYTGTGLEKLLGFLIAIVFLAVYLGIIQVVLTFLGVGFLSDPENELIFLLTFYASFFALVPFILFAIYRARRYKLARTRFRGIRFAMENAAWGYALRAMGHYLLTAISLGALLPRQTFYLEKFMTDRSFYGDARFEQGGRWTALYAAMKHVFIGLGIMVLGGVLAAVASPVMGVIIGVVGLLWLFIGFAYYRVHAFAYLANTKTLDGTVTFKASPRAGEIIKIVVLGSIAVALVGSVGFGILGGALWGMTLNAGLSQSPSVLAIIVTVLGYMSIFVALGALSLVMINQPVIAHLAGTLHVNNIEGLFSIRQRMTDKGADAEGFADALDIGGAI